MELVWSSLIFNFSFPTIIPNFIIAPLIFHVFSLLRISPFYLFFLRILCPKFWFLLFHLVIFANGWKREAADDGKGGEEGSS